MLDHPPLFTLVIRDESEDLTVFSGHKTDLPWTLLSQFGNNYFVYDWSSFIWKSVSREQYSSFKLRYYYLEIATGISDKSLYLETPITHAKQVDNSKTKQRKSRAHPPDTSFAFNQTEHSIKQYIATERLLKRLTEDY